MDTQNQGNTNNVVDIHSRKTVLPMKLRSLLKGQYVESKDQNHDPDTFLQYLERRVISEMAYAAVNIVKDMATDIKENGFNPGDHR